MPLTPDEVHQHAVDRKLKDFQEACGCIDEQLANSYDGDRPISVEIDLKREFNQDALLMRMIEKTYEPLGWLVSWDDHSCEFQEQDSTQKDFALPASRGVYR